MKLSRKYLSGAERAWSFSSPDQNTSVFILPLRISGTPKEIKKFIKLAGSPYTDPEVNDFLEYAINKNNYQTTKDKEYKEELAALEKRKKEFRDKLNNLPKLKHESPVYIIPLRISEPPKEPQNPIKLSESVKYTFNDIQTDKKAFIAKLDDKSKDIMMSVFCTGLEKLEEMLCNNVKDDELQNIYKIGLDEYHIKFNRILEEL